MPRLPIPSSPRRSADRRRSFARVLSLLLPLLLSAIACNLPSIETSSDSSLEYPESQAIYDEFGVSLEEALAVEAEDRRPDVLENMGVPDCFTLRWHELEGQLVRWEEWSYFDFESRFDFVDGELLWTLDIDPAPDGSLYAHFFDPLQFEAYQSKAEVLSSLPELEWVDIALDDADIPGGEFLASDQILLAFDQDRLVYVQTFILEPEEPLDWAFLDETSAINEGPSEAVTSPTEPAAANQMMDEFDDPEQTAQPILSTEYMELSLHSGTGRLSAYYEGMLPAVYPDFVIDDFILSTKLTMPDPSFDGKYGLLFRSDQPDGGLDHYYFLMLEPTEATISIHRYQDELFTLIGEASYQNFVNSPTEPLELELVALGPNFDVSVNGQMILTLQDENPITLPGLIGLAIGSPKPDDFVEFDFVRVEALTQ